MQFDAVVAKIVLYAVLVLIIIALIVGIASFSWADDMDVVGKGLHVGLSAAFGAVADTALFKADADISAAARITIASVLATAPGVYKEELDRQTSGESQASRTRDIALDGIGAILGAVLADRENRLSLVVVPNAVMFTVRW